LWTVSTRLQDGILASLDLVRTCIWQSESKECNRVFWKGKQSKVNYNHKRYP
jgi:hypothetical protein